MDLFDGKSKAGEFSIKNTDGVSFLKFYGIQKGRNVNVVVMDSNGTSNIFVDGESVKVCKHNMNP